MSSVTDELVAGDLVPVPFTLTDDGEPVRIFGAVMVEWRMGPSKVGSALPTVIRPCAIDDDGTDAKKGQGHWSPISGDTDIAGVYIVQFRVVFPSLAVRSFRTERELVIHRRIA